LLKYTTAAKLETVNLTVSNLTELNRYNAAADYSMLLKFDVRCITGLERVAGRDLPPQVAMRC